MFWGYKEVLAEHCIFAVFSFVFLSERWKSQLCEMWLQLSLSLMLFQEPAVGPQQIPMLSSGSRWTWETEWRLQQWPRREDTEALTG